MCAGPQVDKFDIETVQKVYDMWLETTKKAPMSLVMYEWYPLEKAASIATSASAFAGRSADVRPSVLPLRSNDANDWESK